MLTVEVFRIYFTASEKLSQGRKNVLPFVICTIIDACDLGFGHQQDKFYYVLDADIIIIIIMELKNLELQKFQTLH